MVINSSKTGVMLAAVIGILGMMATVILLVGLAFSLKRRKSSRDKSRNEGLLQINLPPVNFGLNQGSFVAQVQPDSTNDGTSRSRFEVLKFWKRSGHAP
uniref:Uncharacterized protein n=1 Tax=Romanomermis culicivorax TaxID=13658 RepID=A0A915LB98_ROMCU